jgi:diaminohydroxyphosphoribosylaminopyrimidine deaminase/5-amino-6-(5-phosphoribosylamino)uracil reductase
MVGCVIALGDRVIGEGFHRRLGGPHAEIHALSSCRVKPRGSTVYVTLEPCCHFGKTPPCVRALIEAGVKRVVAALKDPNPVVNGRSFRLLRQAGVEVETGLLADEARELAAPFLTATLARRPYVTGKWAQSLDGRLSVPRGDSRWITGEPARREVHRLRARVDAVLVGSNTVLADDPMLTARGVAVRRTAMRVVLDRRLRIPKGAKLVVTAGECPTLVLTSSSRSASRKATQLRKKGVEVIGVGGGQGRDRFLKGCLGVLHRRSVTNLLVEGGAEVLSAFWESGFMDEAWVFVAPIFIGGDSRGAFTGLTGSARPKRTLRPRVVQFRKVGDDVMYRLRLNQPPR